MGRVQSSSQPRKLRSRQNSRHLLPSMMRRDSVLFIPGVVKAYSYAMTPYIMA